MTLAAVLCCAMTTVVFTACSNEDNPTFPSIDVNNGVVINLGDIVIKPYLQFGASLADVEKYMFQNYADYKAKDTEALQSITINNVIHYITEYFNGKRSIGLSFANADGTNLEVISYNYFLSTSLEPIMAELERNGFVYKGELDLAPDICHMYLSSDGTIEVMLSSWEKDGGYWSISFQPFDENDLNYLIK